MPALQQFEKPKEGFLQLYSFNPRMIPDEIDPKPILRKLIPRTEEELKSLHKGKVVSTKSKRSQS